jgi:hypothetical protein
LRPDEAETDGRPGGTNHTRAAFCRESGVS